jgi:hypothetical protein
MDRQGHFERKHCAPGSESVTFSVKLGLVRYPGERQIIWQGRT